MKGGQAYLVASFESDFFDVIILEVSYVPTLGPYKMAEAPNTSYLILHL
jgi:hypothetical protein